MGLFRIFPIVVSLVAGSTAQALIRAKFTPQILAEKQKAVKAKLSKVAYTPGNYVVRVIEVRNVGTRMAPSFKLLTDISPKILSLDKPVLTARVSAALEKSVSSAYNAAAKKIKNESMEGLLNIQIDANGVVKALAPVSVGQFKDLAAMRAKRASSVSRPFNVSRSFDPSILVTENQLSALYNDIDPLNHDYMDLMDNCFNRSHYWARSNEIGVSGKNTAKGQQGGLLTSRSSVRSNIRASSTTNGGIIRLQRFR